MILVFLKNLLFPRRQRQRQRQSCKGRRQSSSGSSSSRSACSPITKYGSFTPMPPEGTDGGDGPACITGTTVDQDHNHGQTPLLGRAGPACPLDLEQGLTSNAIDGIDLNSDSDKTRFILSPRVIADAIIGLSDGLTVPFALTAGLSTFNDTRVVVYGGLAELIAGSISMGLGGWLAARGECEYYNSTVAHTLAQITAYQAQQLQQEQRRSHCGSPDSSSPHTPRAQQTPSGTTSPIPQQVNAIFLPYCLPSLLHSSLLSHLLSPHYPPQDLLRLLIHHHHNLSPPTHHRAAYSALTIASGYFLGGFVPLIPYFFVGREEVLRGLAWSVGVMGICLLGFGAWKTVMMDFEGEDAEEEEEEEVGKVGSRWGKVVRGAVEMVLVGGAAAGGAMGIVRFLGGVGG